MALWFLRGVRRGVVTTRYPATPPDEWTRTLDGPPRFRPAMLTEALVDSLAQLCPSQALRRDGAQLVYNVGSCTCCGRCFTAARDAVEPSYEEQLATTNRAHLVKRIPILGGPG